MKTTIHFIVCCLLMISATDPAFAQSKKKKKKKKEKIDYATGLPYLYHNTTSKFNYYFNARELWKESVATAETSYQDNYAQVLPLHKFSVADAKSVEKQADDAIKKISISVTRHRPSRWTDDSYLLLAKLQYLKKDYTAAEEALDFLLAEYSPEAMKAREDKARKAKGKKVKKTPQPKKKKSTDALAEKPKKPKSYFLRHKPAYENGILWMARTYIAQDRFEDADYLLSRLEKSPTTHKNMLDDIAEIRLLSKLESKNYPVAIEQLQYLLDSKPPRKQRSRLNYILAQLYQKEGQSDKALAAFQKALKTGTSYEMEFNSRLNIALNSWRSGKASPEDAVKALEKMLRDAKNKEFKDQIYYTLADIAFQTGKKDEGVALLKKSLAQGGKNQTQKAEAYLQLADYFYANEMFVEASHYYDSTLTVLPATDERFEETRNRGTSLKEIADNLSIIKLQDSLLLLSKMTPAQQKQVALALKKQAAEGKAKPANNEINNSTADVGLINAADAKRSSFFAYDAKAVKKGKREFQAKWGDRPLTDNWRRSNKNAFDTPFVNNDTGNTTSSETTSISDEELAQILKNVPKDESTKQAANKAIEDALFKLGNLYRDRLKQYPQSNATLEKLLSRYPSTEHELDAFYLLYLSHKNLANHAKAKVYYDKILEKYPDSKYARVLKDPNYAKTLGEQDTKLVEYYDVTYSLFKSGNYKGAYDRLQSANQEFGGEHTMKPKYALLTAFCVGKLNGKEEYVKALQEISSRYPDTDEQHKAKEILRYLNIKPSDALPIDNLATTPEVKEGEGGFSANMSEQHYFIIYLDQSAKELNVIKENINEYNGANYKDDNLRASSLFLGNNNEISLLIIRKFKDGETALAYLQKISQKKKEFLGGNYDVQMYPISQSNYRQILKQKNLNGYANFFDKNYKK